MNKTPKEAVELINQLKPLVAQAKCDVVVCPPAVCLAAASEALKGSNIKLGAQNVHWARSGAFTGEISADMLKELDVEYVIIGHSERREYFGETDEGVNKRALFALSNGLIPIICVGESLIQREQGITDQVVSKQVKAALNGFTPENAEDTVIAYEPIWAIGTGKTATSEQANEVIKQIRGVVKELFGEATAEKIRIQYGGSMNPKNVKGLMAQPEIDGGLIGGASLKAPDFTQVVLYNK